MNKLKMVEIRIYETEDGGVSYWTDGIDVCNMQTKAIQFAALVDSFMVGPSAAFNREVKYQGE